MSGQDTAATIDRAGDDVLAELEPAPTLGPWERLEVARLVKRGFDAIVRGGTDTGIRHLRAALRRDPANATAWKALGVGLGRSATPATTDRAARVAEAKAAFRRSLRLDPREAETFALYADLLHYHGGRRRAAARLHRYALRLDPWNRVAAFALAELLGIEGDLAATEAMHRAALPGAGTPTVHLALADLLATQGRWAEAWAVVDAALAQVRWWRWRDDFWDTLAPTPEPAPGRDILDLVGPEGAGDQIASARYVPAVARLGWRVRFHCTAPVARLFRDGLPGVWRLVAPGEYPPVLRPTAVLPHNLLPWRFRTDAATVPPPAALRPDPDDVRRWRGRLAGTGGPKVGLIWGSVDRARSLRLGDLAPLAAAGASFFGLQVGHHAPQAAHPPAGMRFEDLGPDIADFADLAAIMANLDLIVSVDTGPAHLAGSLGRPTWVLVPTNTTYYWGLEGETTAWYPTIRLFRQQRLGDWSDPIARVAAALARLAAGRGAA